MTSAKKALLAQRLQRMLAVITLLQGQGAMHRSELIKRLPGTNVYDLAAMVRARHLKPEDPEDPDSPLSVTATGLVRVGLPVPTHMAPPVVDRMAKPRTPNPRKPYEGEELQPFAGRPGAMDAYQLPSLRFGAYYDRRGNRLGLAS